MRSGRPNLSGAADIALFATAASLAIARVRRAENDQTHLSVFRNLSLKLAQPDWPSGGRLIANVIDLLLSMWLEMTDADLVCCREVAIGTERNALPELIALCRNVALINLRHDSPGGLGWQAAVDLAQVP